METYKKVRTGNDIQKERTESVKASEARLRANQKYHDKYERIQVRVSPKDKETISQHAVARGESLNNFVRRAIAETMERDGKVKTEKDK